MSQPNFERPRVATQEEIANWQYADGDLAATPSGHFNHSQEATALLDQEGLQPDTPIVHAVARAINEHRDEQLKSRPKALRAIAITEATLAEDLPDTARVHYKEQLARQIERTRLLGAYAGRDVHHAVTPQVTAEVAGLEEQAVLGAMYRRIEQDNYPWTMPDSELPGSAMDVLRDIHTSLTEFPEPLPGDVFKVAIPMSTERCYAPEDQALLKEAGLENQGMTFTREELQRAGVFFLNRVGGGEQPLFGVPIPDPGSTDGLFHVEGRAFLTREEFQKVYDYQQEHGYGLSPDLDPADVQMDMIVFAALPNARVEGAYKGAGSAGRENKYGQVRSPFVDLGYVVKGGASIETNVVSGDGSLRMNTTTTHLTDAHPDYPGVSEMFDPQTVAHDQRYISAGDFADTFYEPLPDEEQAFNSIRYNVPTRREAAWVRNAAKV